MLQSIALFAIGNNVLDKTRTANLLKSIVAHACALEGTVIGEIVVIWFRSHFPMVSVR